VARKRLIDTEELYFDTEIVKLLGDRGLHLYIRLWGLAEDWGGYEPKYSDIAFKMGALEFKTEEVEVFINKLIGDKKIIPYQKEGKTFHWLVNLLKHQPLDNPSLPKIPIPKWIDCKEQEYKSGKKYAKYIVIKSRLPVAYRSATSSPRNGNSNGNRVVTIAKAGERTPVSNKPTENLVLKTLLKQVYKSGFNIYQLINKFKKEAKKKRLLMFGEDYKIPDEILIEVAQSYLKNKVNIKGEPFPWVISAMSKASSVWWVRKQDVEHLKIKIDTGTSRGGEIENLQDILKKMLPEGVVNAL
jgi:hypothetical protein